MASSCSTCSILFPFVSIKVIPLQQSQHVINQLYIHKIKDFTDPTETVLIEKILEGFKWLKSTQDIHAPIMKELLTVFASYMLQWIWKLIIQVTIHISVFCFLLCREVSLHRLSLGRICLTVDDITFSDNKLIVRVWISKTHKTEKKKKKKKESFFCISLVGDKSICPIAAMQQFIWLRSSVSGYNHQFQVMIISFWLWSSVSGYDHQFQVMIISFRLQSSVSGYLFMVTGCLWLDTSLVQF